MQALYECNGFGGATGKWKGVTVAVKIVEHNAETESELVQLRESLLSSSVVHPNVVSPSLFCLMSVVSQIPELSAACKLCACVPFPHCNMLKVG